MKPNTKIAIGIIMAIVLLAFIPTYDLVFKNKIDSVEVVVVAAGKEIKPQERITEKKLSIERRRKQDLIGDVVLAEQMNEIIGYDAADLMVSNAMISEQMVDFDNLIPDESKGEAIRPIPEWWIYAKPGSLRRKDSIDIYTISNTFAESEGEESNVVSSDSSTDLEKEKEELGLKEPLLTNVKVIYVKDGSNQEVMNTSEQPSNDGERLNATSTIAELEVILDEEKFQRLIKSTVDKGQKLYITYN